MNSEEMMTAATIARDAAKSMADSADRVEAAVRKLTCLLDEGYGNNVERLIELLDRVKLTEEKPDEPVRLLTAAEVAEILKISEWRVSFPTPEERDLPKPIMVCGEKRWRFNDIQSWLMR